MDAAFAVLTIFVPLSQQRTKPADCGLHPGSNARTRQVIGFTGSNLAMRQDKPEISLPPVKFHMLRYF